MHPLSIDPFVMSWKYTAPVTLNGSIRAFIVIQCRTSAVFLCTGTRDINLGHSKGLKPSLRFSVNNAKRTQRFHAIHRTFLNIFGPSISNISFYDVSKDKNILNLWESRFPREDHGTSTEGIYTMIILHLRISLEYSWWAQHT